jgi:hypothetical protein
MANAPPRSSSKSAPNTGSESKRGMQDQTIEPSRRTSAQSWQFPMRPRSESGKLMG